MKEEQWTIIKVLKWTTQYFSSLGIEQPRTDAEVLLAHVLGYERLDLYLNFDQPLTKAELAKYREAIKRRARREPVQYITERQEFWSLPIRVTPAVLIPRPETECLVETALKICREKLPETDQLHILDIGTGSGAISLALAKELPEATIFASDLSFEAILLAKQNAKELTVQSGIHFFVSNLCEALGKKAHEYFDIVMSNPPYISDSEYQKLPPEIRNYEPKTALHGGENGTLVIKDILVSAAAYLKSGGCLVLEIGSTQGALLRQFAGTLAWVSEIDIEKDYSGLDRVLIVRKK
ncbi:MAG TPA: peptide chain release factor N(5)-glutamine methyltransferase [Deltaproteobacteria bacterium]|nr:peptide chain release factor N(5)-glutamine methyltransferase [Deltaproteobacteria bacterium]